MRSSFLFRRIFCDEPASTSPENALEIQAAGARPCGRPRSLFVESCPQFMLLIAAKFFTTLPLRRSLAGEFFLHLADQLGERERFRQEAKLFFRIQACAESVVWIARHENKLQVGVCLAQGLQ